MVGWAEGGPGEAHLVVGRKKERDRERERERKRERRERRKERVEKK